MLVKMYDNIYDNNIINVNIVFNNKRLSYNILIFKYLVHEYNKYNFI